jgi:hypothetical protein
MFSKLDRADGTVTFLDERDPQDNAQLILSALVVLPLVEAYMPSLERTILQVADLQHRISPVGGGEAKS